MSDFKFWGVEQTQWNRRIFEERSREENKIKSKGSGIGTRGLIHILGKWKKSRMEEDRMETQARIQKLYSSSLGDQGCAFRLVTL